MPKYTYKCKECDYAFEAVHGMFVKLQNCDECSMDGTLLRVPSVSYSMKSKVSSDKKTGEIVKEFIDSAKQEVEKQKKEMTEEFKK